VSDGDLLSDFLSLGAAAQDAVVAKCPQLCAASMDSRAVAATIVALNSCSF
jgi:hypothetical protein